MHCKIIQDTFTMSESNVIEVSIFFPYRQISLHSTKVHILERNNSRPATAFSVDDVNNNLYSIHDHDIMVLSIMTSMKATIYTTTADMLILDIAVGPIQNTR